jgi:hypothetical protein
VIFRFDELYFIHFQDLVLLDIGPWVFCFNMMEHWVGACDCPQVRHFWLLVRKCVQQLLNLSCLSFVVMNMRNSVVPALLHRRLASGHCFVSLSDKYNVVELCLALWLGCLIRILLKKFLRELGLRCSILCLENLSIFFSMRAYK